MTGEANRQRRERAAANDPADPFIDPAGDRSFIDRADAHFREALADQQSRR